ncbi:SDR family oxidoreductase [Martelella mediterranea]|uniref:SDR family oxidoreductase n=1 Tax=Martelella mediterranea TaxID=293089 RepID=UPI001E469FED|nr:SDR family oxidoreductase [Martelella mediterranea]MCD1633730.1 SDR family oxidoreductase [Martelella mediterranea]
MRIFLTGATGFIGSAIVPNLLNDDHEVLGLARSEPSAEALRQAGCDVLRGDLRDLESLRRGVEQADAVIHTAFDHDFSRMAENCEMDRIAIEAMGSALAGSNKRFIVTSGLPPLTGRVSTETDILPAGAHGMPRVSEQVAMALTDSGVSVSVIRMPQVHDRNRQGFASYLMDHARKKGVSAYVGDGQNRWPAVHRLDAARLYGLVLDNGVSGERFHAVSEEGVAVRDVAEAIGKRLDVPVMSLSDEDSAGHFGWLDRIARMDVPASSVLTRQKLNWQPMQKAGLIQDILDSV